MNQPETALDHSLPVCTLYVGSRDGEAFPHCDRKKVLDEIALAFDSFTAIDAEGYYKGKCVATLVIKIATDDQTAVKALARQLGGLLAQQTVSIETGGYFRSLPMD
jgi:hypothetical protein